MLKISKSIFGGAGAGAGAEAGAEAGAAGGAFLTAITVVTTRNAHTEKKTREK